MIRGLTLMTLLAVAPPVFAKDSFNLLSLHGHPIQKLSCQMGNCAWATWGSIEKIAGGRTGEVTLEAVFRYGVSEPTGDGSDGKIHWKRKPEAMRILCSRKRPSVVDSLGKAQFDPEDMDGTPMFQHAQLSIYKAACFSEMGND
jgi:hypothetical protein